MYNLDPSSIISGSSSLIIFTITNKITSQAYVGSTRNDLLDQWEKMVAAAEQNIDYPLYEEIRIHGRDSFVVEEWDFAEDRNELLMLEKEAIESLNAQSLKGYKTSQGKFKSTKKNQNNKCSMEKELTNIENSYHGDLDDFDDISVESKKQVKEDTETKVQAKAQELLTTSANSEQSCRLNSSTPKVGNNGWNIHSLEKSESETKLGTNVHSNHIALHQKHFTQGEKIGVTVGAVNNGDSISGDNAKDPSAANDFFDINVVGQPVSENVTSRESKTLSQSDPKEKQIRDAIERHRNERAKKLKNNQASDRQKIEQLLNELNVRAASGNDLVSVLT